MILAPYPFHPRHDEEELPDDRRIDFATLIAWLFAGELSEPRFEQEARSLGAASNEIESVLIGLRQLDGVA